MTLQEKRARMLALVSDWQTSGLTQQAFSAQHGIKAGTFSYWVSRPKEPDPATSHSIPLSPGLSKVSSQAEIYPGGDLSEMICIGKEVTEELECVPARLFIKRYICYKYAPKNGEGVVTGQLPERVIDKGIPGAGLLAMILTGKYQDHLPLYQSGFCKMPVGQRNKSINGW